MNSIQRETILYEKSGPVARLTMNRPDRLNGMTNRMLVETRDALAAAAEDRDLRVLILTGAGKGFCPSATWGKTVQTQLRLRHSSLSIGTRGGSCSQTAEIPESFESLPCSTRTERSLATSMTSRWMQRAMLRISPFDRVAFSVSEPMRS